MLCDRLCTVLGDGSSDRLGVGFVHRGDLDTLKRGDENQATCIPLRGLRNLGSFVERDEFRSKCFTAGFDRREIVNLGWPRQ